MAKVTSKFANPESVFFPGVKLYKASVLRPGETIEYEIADVIEYDYSSKTARVELESVPSGKAMAWITLPNKEYCLTKEEALKDG